MNQTINDILNRRSTRVFGEGTITDEAIELIVNAGLHAPSAHNHQSWHFTVVQNKDLLDELNLASKEAAKSFPEPMIQKMANNENLHVFYNAPVAIIISGNENAMMPQADCGAATQNLLIAAESLNVASCWVGFVAFAFGGANGTELREKLSIPEGFKPYYAVALGNKRAGTPEAKAPGRRENTVSYVR